MPQMRNEGASADPTDDAPLRSVRWSDAKDSQTSKKGETMPAARWTEKDVAKTNAGKLTKTKAELTKKPPKVVKADPTRRVMRGGVAVDRKSKYFNERVKVDGIWFDSRLEAGYYERLKLEKMAGKVSWFVIKPVFHLRGGIKYIADFLVVRDDKLVMGSQVQVIDTKGLETDVFKLKRKLMLEEGIEIRVE